MTFQKDYSLNFLGSSETIREVSFKFDLFIKNSVLHKKKVKTSELEWLIGFTEGDGSFITSKDRNFFILTQKSYKTLCKVKRILGFGSISKAGEYFRFIVASHEGVFRLLCLFNGNLLLNKTNERFKLWLSNYNKLNNTNLTYKLGPNLQQYKSNCWLSGFIDAEGCFYALLRHRQSRYRSLSLRLSLFIDQKAELEVLTQIAREFGGFVTRISKNKTLSVDNSEEDVLSELEFYRVVLSSKESRQQIIQYLSNNTLLGDKQISYLRWKRLHEAELIKMNPEKVKNLCKNINKR